MNYAEDLYEILQVHHAAEPEVIEAAYRRLLRMYHPDVNKTPEAHEITVRLNTAYEALRDPAKRANYDRRRSSQTQYDRRQQERQAEKERQTHTERDREAQTERERRRRERQGHSVYDVLNAAFPMFESQGDYRFEVRPRSSIYVRKYEHRGGRNVGRINVSSARNFPNAQVLLNYINTHGIQDDNRDYLIGAEHIGRVIRILS